MKNVVALANVVLGASTMILAITIFTIGGYLAISSIYTTTNEYYRTNFKYCRKL